MGLLEQVISGAIASRMGGGMGRNMGGGMGGGMGSPLMMALMALLASRGMGGGMMGGGGGLGGMLGGMLGGGMGGGMGGPMGGMAGGGGLGGLIDMFRSRGHGDAVDSWVGHGPNRLMAPTELEEALGPDTVEQLQQQTGMDRGDMLQELSHVLPGVVDQLTPHGRPPTEEEMGHW
ncbi:YidB family protein [Salinarimonas soli]|uniref:DUF937 domain-containing protein n=1 Tax=Salinarimonas soli TaxID=1638099 RepID=A0A5B2VCT8_9HYPH|nr:YidB family protein [Salinarimonas soli]KAA2237303.1 DUF937 domain-containing protein [Salinarimonas soli]